MSDILRSTNSDKPKPETKPVITYKTSWSDRLLVFISHLAGAGILFGIALIFWVMFGTFVRSSIGELLATIVFILLVNAAVFVFLRGVAFLGETMIFQLDHRRLRFQVFLFDKQVAFKAVPLQDIQAVQEDESGDVVGIGALLDLFLYQIFHRRTFVEIEIQKKLSRRAVHSAAIHKAYFQPEVDAPIGSRLKIYTRNDAYCIPKSTVNYKIYRDLTDRLLGGRSETRPPKTQEEMDNTKFRVIMPDEYEDET